MTIAEGHSYGASFSPNASPEPQSSLYDDDLKDNLFDEDDARPKKSTGRKGSGPGAADKRATHNAIERARRESLNGRFMTLAEALPSMANVKRPSKSIIVNRALDFVFDAQVKEHALIKENNELRLQVDQLRARLGMAPLPPPAPLPNNERRHSPTQAQATTTTTTTPTSASPTFSSPSPVESFAALQQQQQQAVSLPAPMQAQQPLGLGLAPHHHALSQQQQQPFTFGTPPPEGHSPSSTSSDSLMDLSQHQPVFSLPPSALHAAAAAAAAGQQQQQQHHQVQQAQAQHTQNFAGFGVAQAQALLQAQYGGYLNPNSALLSQQHALLLAQHMQSQQQLQQQQHQNLDPYASWAGQSYSPLEPYPFPK